MSVMAKAKQKMFLGNGNDAAAEAIMHIGYDGEGYYPITPSSEVGELINKANAEGRADVSFIIGTSELAAIGICAGMSLAGGRVVDVTSAQGATVEGRRDARHLRHGFAHGAQSVLSRSLRATQH